MNKEYLKTLMSIIVVSMVVIITPNAFAECTNLDNSSLTLTPTTDSITVNWLDLGCEIPIDATIQYTLTLDSRSNSPVEDPVNGHIFTNLESDTEYTVTLDIAYQYESGDLYSLGTLSQTIRTEVVEPIEEDNLCIVGEANVIDLTYMTLTSTTNSITVDFSPDNLGCDIPEGSVLFNFIILDDNNMYDRAQMGEETSFTFTNLEPSTEYDVKLQVFYDGMGETGTLIGELDTIIGTQADDTEEELPVEEPEDEFPTEVEPVEIPKEKGTGGCADCVAPTIGINTNNFRIVENGFSYNNNPVDVERWHTPYPLITAIVNQTNTVEIIAYDNQGLYNLKLVQFGLGLEEIGQGLHDAEVLIEVHLESLRSENTVIVEKVVIRDRENLIETFSVFADTDVVKCFPGTLDVDCLKVTIQYAYREATLNNIMVVHVVDKPGNAQNFYMNEGVEVFGDSINEPPTYVIQNRKTHQQTEDLTLTLTRTDKVSNIWEDKYGIQYLQVSSDRFDRITPHEPIQCNDKSMSQSRNNCHFRALTSLWDN